MEDSKKEKETPELKEELTEDELKGLSGGNSTDKRTNITLDIPAFKMPNE